jgi:hypothetical protein
LNINWDKFIIARLLLGAIILIIVVVIVLVMKLILSLF